MRMKLILYYYMSSLRQLAVVSCGKEKQIPGILFAFQLKFKYHQKISIQPFFFSMFVCYLLEQETRLTHRNKFIAEHQRIHVRLS